MPHTLPDLPYDFAALEPHIDAKTMNIHWDKHHRGYVNNLNNAIEAAGGDWAGKSLDDIVKNIGSAPDAQKTALRNNGGGHFNHSMFWKLMKNGGGGNPTGALLSAIDSDLGGMDKFREAFNKAAGTRFGSGWAWLVVKGGKLVVGSTANQDNPLMGDAIAGISGTPIMGLDVWEHAYYLNYQNRRPDYVAAWWNVVNWDEVARLYDAAKG